MSRGYWDQIMSHRPPWWFLEDSQKIYLPQSVDYFNSVDYYYSVHLSEEE